MLDQALKQQLKEHFAALSKPVELVYHSTEHAKQDELVAMLNDIAETSSWIASRPSGQLASIPTLELHCDGVFSGVRMVGIPGGHEFSSLILAILNLNGLGKQPDRALIDRVRRLKGPIRLKTYVSLSCENCPDVVQALNLMAIWHDDFEHQMIDGELVVEEVEQLKIQGVPSVMRSDQSQTLVSSGKATLAGLLDKLEALYGSEAAAQESPQDLGQYDVVVVGGGPAGASAAIYTVRKGLKTAMITDRVGGQMKDTKGIENFVSMPYVEGPQLSAHLDKHMQSYPIDILEHRRVEHIDNGQLKTLRLNSGETIATKALIVATGAKWRELNVEGEKEYIGRGVAFCPHCDGPYYKGKDIAVVGGGNSGVEAAIDLAGIVKSVTLLEFMDTLKADQVLVEKLKSLDNVTVLTHVRVHRVVGDGEQVIGLEYQDRTTEQMHTLDLDGVFVQIGLVPNSGFIKDLVATNPYGEIIVDQKCKTNVAGIYAAGDVTTVPYKQIVIAMGEGAKAGLSAFEGQML